MSIRPVQVALPTPPPQATARQAGQSPTAPVALPQAGAPAVSENGLSIPATAGMASASQEQTGTTDAQAPGNDQATKPTDLAEAIERAENAVNAQVRDFSFSIHEKTGEVVVRIIDRESKEVIRQIPAEEMLRIAEHLQSLEGENTPGLLLRQEV
jgi:flagellar protein FlaG